MHDFVAELPRQRLFLRGMFHANRITATDDPHVAVDDLYIHAPNAAENGVLLQFQAAPSLFAFLQTPACEPSKCYNNKRGVCAPHFHASGGKAIIPA